MIMNIVWSNSTRKKKHLAKKNLIADSSQENHKEFIKYNKWILQSQQKFRSEKHNVFT